ncbi:hypothetical protein BJP27_24180 (plasmid) [Pseudomonas oryzihabitans]|nr:hypothetical protein BJP27_24180 [Pseudomonas psychrotolerans]
MSTLPASAPVCIHLVAAYSSVEPDYHLQAFLDPDRAQGFLQALRDYETTRPERQVLANDEDEALGDWLERVKAWSQVHPGGEHAAMYGQFAIRAVPLADSPTLLGYANAKELRHFQLGAAAGGRNDLVIAKDQASHWRSRERDGEPVPVYTR